MITEAAARYGGVHTRTLTVDGDGPPFVLLHGFSDSADTWRGVLHELERNRRGAVAVDLPGFGAADKLHPGAIFPQLDTFVDAIAAEHGPVVLMGNSLGSVISVRAAIRGSKTIRAVISTAEPALADHWLARNARLPKESSLFRLLGARLPVPRRAVRLLVRRSVSRSVYADRQSVAPEVIARWAAAVPDYRTLGTLARQARQIALETAPGYRSTEAITCPLLILHGAKDRIIPVHASRRLHQLIPDSTLQILNHCGHCPQLDDPAGLTDLALRFLDR